MVFGMGGFDGHDGSVDMSSIAMLFAACREWLTSTTIDKTWTGFKQNFSKAYRDHQENKPTTTEEAGYSATITAINEIHNVTEQHNETVTNLQQSMSSMQEQLRNLQTAQQQTNDPTPQQPSRRQENNYQPHNATRYFWTHGFKNHNIHECLTPIF